MNASELWEKVGHLFNTDDGSLPDIFVEDLSNDEIVSVYEFVMTHALLEGNAKAWSIKEEKDIPLREITNPAKLFIENRIEAFRHSILLRFEGVELPCLSVAVAQESIAFDYRMGNEWNKESTSALFSFLAKVQAIVPDSKITQADEGGYEEPNEVFQRSLHEFIEK